MSSTLKYKKRFEHFYHDGSITSVALDTSGSILAAGSLDGNISIWAVDTGSALHRVNARTPVLSLVWLTGSEGFVFGCENGILASVLLEEVCIKTVYFHAHSGPITCISPNFNDKLLISGAANEVTVWKRDRHYATREDTWEMFKSIPQPPEQYSQTGRLAKVTSVNWLLRRNSSDSERGQKFIITSYLWHGVMCWDLASLAIMWRLAIPDCLSLALSPDGSLVAAYGASNSFEVYDTETHHLTQALHWEARPDLSSPPVTFAHDGFAIVSGGTGKASIWDVEHGDELQTLDHGGTSNVTAVTAYFSASADRFLIVTGAYERDSSCITLWDAIPYGHGSKANAPEQVTEMRAPLANRLTWMVIGVAAMLSWRWISPT